MAKRLRQLRSLGPVVVVLALAGVVVTASLMTQFVFARYEGRALQFHEALLFVAETMTTVGYGEQTPLASPVTVLWSIALMVLGFVLVVVWLTTLTERWLARRIQLLPSRRASTWMRRHVLIVGNGTVARFLAEELMHQEIAHLMFVETPEQALALQDRGYSLIFGDPQSRESLQDAGLDRCRAIVTTGSDEENASVALLVRSLAPNVPVYATVEHGENEPLLQAAGASEVISAKAALGERLARMALEPLPGALQDIREQVQEVALCQIPVLPRSELSGESLRSSRLRERTGAVVLGVWWRGHFELPDPDRPLVPGVVLLAAAEPDELNRLRRLAGGESRSLRPPEGMALVLGYGDVGQAVVERLNRAGVPCRVLTRPRSEPAAANQPAAQRGRGPAGGRGQPAGWGSSGGSPVAGPTGWPEMPPLRPT